MTDQSEDKPAAHPHFGFLIGAVDKGSKPAAKPDAKKPDQSKASDPSDKQD